ncbi:MAG: SDR family oxidoreductase [bacterium]|nr:SDR family oxidoreductase [bacterium]
MNVFVTGHRGYIGSHLVELLKEAGHRVTGCDLGLFDGCEWEPLVPPDRELTKDVRDLTAQDLEGHDAVMHLAAISNDPMGELDEALTYSVNLHGSVRLARIAKEAGVPRWLFSSSCSIYGKGVKLDLDEESELRPLSAYAVSKVETEKRVRELADRDFSPSFLRNATAYGHSRNLRIDLVANNLLACAFARGDIRIDSDGTPWRPLTHCRDIARAFLAFAEAPRETVHNAAANIGADGENYQVKDVADRVKRLVPKAEIVFTGKTGADPRNYRVAFGLLRRLLPGFELQYDLDSGMEELCRKFGEHGFSAADFEGERFVRLRTLRRRMDRIRRGEDA